jgi:hypothetical protein
MSEVKDLLKKQYKGNGKPPKPLKPKPVPKPMPKGKPRGGRGC